MTNENDFKLLGDNPIQSFWMAGFECADHLNAFGHRVDLLVTSRHLARLHEDYEGLRPFGLGTVREGIRWSEVEKSPYRYDWASVAKVIEAARENQVQVIWDICHFGYAHDLTPLHPLFPRRFAALCRAFATFYRRVDPSSTLIVTPINEVSFISWLGGDVRGTSPYCTGQGWEVKYRLVKAYIEGIEALKEVDPGIRVLITEPLVNVVPSHRADAAGRAHAERVHNSQFEVADMLSGRLCPELRGQPSYIDLVGCNYYYNNQWVADPHRQLNWKTDRGDKRWIPLHRLLKTLYERYRRPIVLSETSHAAEDRPLWMKQVADECALALRGGVPLWGICWYPIVDRPDWDHLDNWHHSGLWDRGATERELHEPTAEALRAAQETLAPWTSEAAVR